MAGDKREVRVAVVGDAGQLQRELLKAEGKLNSFGANATKAGDTLRSALFGGAVLYGAKQLVDAAASLEQAIGGTAAVFEQASGPVNEFAKNAANVAGLSEEAARTLTSRLGASLKGFGLSAEDAAKQSVFLAQTGADLAATLGGTTDEAVTALGAALRGEYDPLERFGIALKASDVNAKAVAMGLADSEASVSTYAKGQAALALITEKSAFAQGQFTREADTASGQAAIAAAKTKDASASLGKSLLPVYTKIQEVVAAVADAFSALPGPVQTGVIALTAVALIGPKLYTGISSAVTAIRALPAALEKAALSAVGTQNALNGMQLTTGVAGQAGAAAAVGGLSTLTIATGGLALAAIAGGLAWKNYNDQQTEARNRAKELGQALDANTGRLNDQTESFIRQKLEAKNQIDNLNKASISVRDFTNAIADDSKQMASRIQLEEALKTMQFGSAEAQQKTVAALRELGGERNNLFATLIENEALDRGLLDTIVEQSRAYDDNQKAIRDQIVQKAVSTGKSEQQAEAEAKLKEATEKATKAIKDNADAMRAARDPYFKVYESVLSVEEAQKTYNETLRQYGVDAPQTQQATKDLAQAGFEYLDALSALAVAQGEGKASADELQRQFQLLVAAGVDPNAAAMVRLKDRILEAGGAAIFVGGLQPQIKITADITEAQRALRELVGLTRELTGEYGQGLGIVVKKRASGGPVDAGTPYIVGEKGPELFLPSTAGRIIDAFSTSKALLENVGGGGGMGGGSVVNINVSVAPTADKAAIGQSIVEAISSFERRSGAGWRS